MKKPAENKNDGNNGNGNGNNGYNGGNNGNKPPAPPGKPPKPPKPPVEPKPRILFILKLRHLYGAYGKELKSSGLKNSATYVCDMLVKNGFESKTVQVVDNNDIDRVVTEYKPDVVVIEALWVVPSKFEVLRNLHPNVKWIIRLHSEIPFLANEGIAMEWINEYIVQPNVFVSFNSWETQKNFMQYMKAISPSLVNKLIYLPNYYPVKSKATPSPTWKPGDVIDIGCFGAVRPMKNHLMQAAAAIEFCERKKLKLRFHINAERVEGRGDTVLRNLREMFEPLAGKHELVEHPWLEREAFLELVGSMDFGLQVSMSETFNIVSADFVSEDTPIVTSKEVDWMPDFFCAEPTILESIVDAMDRVMKYDRHWVWLERQRKALMKYVNESEEIWVKEFTPGKGSDKR
jgi:hypothetical protein